MALRKGHCYTHIKRSNTRKSKVKSKSYVKTVPPMKIARFMMGDIQGYYTKKYKFSISLVVDEDIQIRDNALESARQFINRHLENTLKGNYFMIVSAFPHHILRENKMITGAGADRMQTGMSHSFGATVGVAAQIPKGRKIFDVLCDKESVAITRKVLDKAKTKLPGRKTIVIKKVN
jgi:large subunit ribosomal protein L10e